MRHPRNLLVCAVALAAVGCVELEVTNPGEPDALRALSDPATVAAQSASVINEWWLAATTYDHSLMMQGTADALTGNCCYIRFNNFEPRIPYNNQPQGGDELLARRPWQMHYAAAHRAADALAALDAGVLARDSVLQERARAAALFSLAATHASLGFAFDQGFVVTRPVNARGLPTLQPYTALRDAALVHWDALIALTAGKSWALDADALPLAAGAPTADRVHRIARTMAARTLVLSARTAAQNAATDWGRVLAYADGGITGAGLDDMDFSIVDDGGLRWYDYIKLYGAYPLYGTVDQRLIHRMAPNIPARFNGLANQPVPQPVDARLGLAALPCDPDPIPCTEANTEDYVFLGRVYGDAARGVFMQSPFYHNRYSRQSFLVPSAVRTGRANPHVLAAENDLMIAEALVRTGGSLARAAALVNKTRVGRGGLSPVAAEGAALLAAIEYERDVELLNTSALALFDRRRVDGLQPGTFRHLPVPARELEALGLPLYTFGGVGSPDQ